MQYQSVSEIARPRGIDPQRISMLFYRRRLRDDLCPIVGGRRLIPHDYVPEILRALEEAPRKMKQSRPSAKAV
jgi:hypothetical protein